MSIHSYVWLMDNSAVMLGVRLASCPDSLCAHSMQVYWCDDGGVWLQYSQIRTVSMWCNDIGYDVTHVRTDIIMLPRITTQLELCLGMQEMTCKRKAIEQVVYSDLLMDTDCYHCTIARHSIHDRYCSVLLYQITCASGQSR